MQTKLDRLVRRVMAAMAVTVLVALGTVAQAQERLSFPAGSSPAVVERMVKVAGLRDGDVVIDLGSFDGRIVFAAVKSHPKVRGWGVDIAGEWVRKANEAAKEMGLADRAQFFHRNAFDADLRDVSVINMWLFRDLTQLLRPKILAETRPGTRIVVNGALVDNHEMLGKWQPDVVDRGAGAESPIFVWIVPARVEGAWQWELAINGVKHVYDLLMSQQFQIIEGFARTGVRRENLIDPRLRGDEISFGLTMTVPGSGLTRHQFRGRVEGDQIRGTATINPAEGKPQQEVAWVARRSHPAAWFRYTGVNLN